MNLYGLYRNEKLEIVGTAREIAEHENISIKTVHYYTTPTYEKRRKSDSSKRVIKMDKEKLELKNKVNKIEQLYFMGFKLKNILLMEGADTD